MLMSLQLFAAAMKQSLAVHIVGSVIWVVCVVF
jgi:hypothetical protein